MGLALTAYVEVEECYIYKPVAPPLEATEYSYSVVGKEGISPDGLFEDCHLDDPMLRPWWGFKIPSMWAYLRDRFPDRVGAPRGCCPEITRITDMEPPFSVTWIKGDELDSLPLSPNDNVQGYTWWPYFVADVKKRCGEWRLPLTRIVLEYC